MRGWGPVGIWPPTLVYHNENIVFIRNIIFLRGGSEGIEGVNQFEILLKEKLDAENGRRSNLGQERLAVHLRS